MYHKRKVSGLHMKRIPLLFLSALLLTGCAQKEDTEMLAFKDEINEFCDKIVEIDASINEITNESADGEGLESAKRELLSCLDDLKDEFSVFASLDFPEEFDYLESIADEASTYMTEAVKSYHEAYKDNSYNEYTADYAGQNYSRAYKRVQIILDFLQGKTPEDENLTIEYTE